MLSPLNSRETTGSKEEYDNLYTTDCKPNTPFKQAFQHNRIAQKYYLFNG